MTRYGHLVFYAVVLLAIYGFVRPGSKAGKAVTSVTESFAGVLGKNTAGGMA